jgi:hypothetical protein
LREEKKLANELEQNFELGSAERTIVLPKEPSVSEEGSDEEED